MQDSRRRRNVKKHNQPFFFYPARAILRKTDHPILLLLLGGRGKSPINPPPFLANYLAVSEFELTTYIERKSASKKEAAFEKYRAIFGVGYS